MPRFNLSKEQADCVRWLRVDCGQPWRALAGNMSVLYPELEIKLHLNRGQVGGCCPDGYQGDGMDLCSDAAAFFGENANDDPWN